MTHQDLAIVVVDDMHFSCATIEDSLRRAGHLDIRTASGARQAVELLEERRADVLLADWIMPEMDGLQLSDLIRQQDEHANHYTSIILITSREGVEPLVEAFERGVDDYLCKPFNARELAARVHNAGRISSLQNSLLQTSQALTEANRQLAEMATTDPLTGLGNRRYLNEQLDAMLREASARERAVCCAIIDLDHFKQINDRHGHDIGDEVLCSFATRLRRTVRPTDLVTRMGGEEFAVGMQYLDATQFKPSIFERILRHITQRPIVTSAVEIPVTASIGVCCYTPDQKSMTRDELLKCADAKLYRAKQEGRNRVVF